MRGGAPDTTPTLSGSKPSKAMVLVLADRPTTASGDSPARLLQGAAVGVVATFTIGFLWGSWSLASTTQKQVEAAEQLSVVRVLAPICADRFARATVAKANLEALNKEDSWKRDE